MHKNFVRSYYNSLYKSKDYGYVVQPDAWLQKYASYIPRGIVLELGIGTGKNVDYLLSQGYQIEGVDISDIAISQLCDQYAQENCTFWVDDITQMNIPEEKYALIICSMVISHLTESQIVELISKIKRGLIHGGCVYISTMSKDDPMNNKQLNMGKSLKRGDIDISVLKRTFLEKEQMKAYFADYDIIELADIYQKEPKRTTTAGYFGLILYLGKKQ